MNKKAASPQKLSTPIYGSVLTWLYSFETIKRIKDFISPAKHFIFGANDVYYVVDVIRSVRGSADPVRVVFDVGAAIGEKTLTFLRYFPEAQVYAFEPQSRSRERLLKRTAAWRDRVNVLPWGLAETEGTATLRLYSYADASSLLPIPMYLAHQGKQEVGSETIRIRSLDDCFRELGLGGVDFLKIDVEGVELGVIRGAQRTLQITDNVFAEIEPLRLDVHNGNYIEVFRLLHESGFTYMGLYGDYWFSKDPYVIRSFFVLDVPESP